MSINTFFLNIVKLEKEKDNKGKDIPRIIDTKIKKEKISPKSSLSIKRNESWENFVKFSWGWIS
jgi:hypothetical protein